MNIRLLALCVSLANLLNVTADEPSSSTGDPSASPTSATSRTESPENADPDDAQRKTVERFVMVLERNPRKGTALDRVIEFHSDRGTLDELARQQRKKAEAIGGTQAAEAGRAWMVVGLIEDSRGETEAAIEAFQRTEQLLPTNAMASFVLGQSLLTLNHLPQAAEAFERAIQRKPAPVDLLDIFQSLGRVRQRLAEGDQVVEVWTRLENLVPNDPRVPELIALTLLEDGHIEAALPRFETLAKAAKDPAKRSQFELEAIDIRLRLGQTEQALADSERMLAGLKPEHWLFREIRRRIEQAFVANGDEAGLIKHFEARLEKRPDDVDAVVRLSRVLVGQSRPAEARSWLEAALKQAPSSSVLRLELIELLEQDHEFAEAVAQYEQLDKIEPNHTDHIRDWGFLILKEGERGGVSPPVTLESVNRPTNRGPNGSPLASNDHAKRAATIWRKLVEAKPKDALVAAQVAELMRQADLFDGAAELLRRAIELAPEALHYRETLGEVLHSQQKHNEALAAWRSMAEGSRRSAENLGQLADVLGRRGFSDESLKTIDAACELDRKSLELRFQQADLRRMWKQFDTAREALQLAAELADSPETFDRIVQREIELLTEAEQLPTATDDLQATIVQLLPLSLGEGRGEGRRLERPSKLEKTSPKENKNVERPSSLTRPSATLSQGERDFSTSSPAAQWFRLARYLEAGTRLREATSAAHKAVELAPRVSLFLQAAARMLAADNQWQAAIDVYERLIVADRKFRVDSLHAIAELDSKLGRRDRALKAGRDLLSATPGNANHAEFVADLCLRFNLQPEALQILRRSSRQNPADKRLALKLTEQLLASPVVQASGGRQPPGSPDGLKTSHPDKVTAVTPGGLRPPLAMIDEAREALWRVFEKSSKLDDRLEVIRKLTELAVVPGEFDRLTQRLTRLRQEPSLSRDATLCLVQVHEQAGDTGQARRELERLLPQSPRDPDLLRRLTSLSEATGDLEAAISHQRRLLDVTRSREADEHLVVLLRRAGRDSEADTLATRWLEFERDPVKVLKEIDRLLGLEPLKEKSRPNVQRALALAQMWLDREPENWEFLLRYGIGLLDVGQTKEANFAFDKMLALPVSDDALSVLSPRPSAGSSSTSRISERVHQIRQRMRQGQLSETFDYGAARSRVLRERLRALDDRPNANRLAGGVSPAVASNDAKAKTKNRKPNDVPQTGGLTPPASQVPKEVTLRQCWDAVYRKYFHGSPESLMKASTELLDVAPEDAGAQWLFLSSLRHRPTPNAFSNWNELEGMNPLNAEILDRLPTLLRQLQSCDEAMEWEHVPLIEFVCRELARAKRSETARELLAEFEKSTESPDALAWLLQAAAMNDDAESALRVVAKFSSLDFAKAKGATGVRGATLRFDPAKVAWWLSRLMIRHRKKLSDGLELSAENLRILDAAFAAFSQPNFGRSATKARVATPATLPHSGGFEKQLRLIQTFVPYDLGLVWQTTTLTGYLEESFPSAEGMPELSVIHVLRQAWSQAGTPRERINLFRHVKAAADRAEIDSRQRFLWEVALTSLEWWNHWTPDGKLQEPSPQRDSLTMMRGLFEFDEASPALKLGIVLCHLKYEQRDLALDLLDRIATTDGQQLKEIEKLAIQIAGKLGRVERVRVAAERLFGMRLEPQEELQLASTLSGLGLHEQAEAIRRRGPQRFGNDVGSLLALLEQRLKEDKPNEAAQVAEQILLRTHPAGLASSVSGATGAGTQPSSPFLPVAQQARKKALETLASAGRLGPFIEQAEKQFDRSPQSLKLFGQLAELYMAEVPPKGGTTNGGANEKIARLLDRLADSDAPDPQFRLTLARALVSAGKAQLAGPHFLFAIERLPNATAQVLFEAEQILSELGHTEELATIVLKSKLAVNDQQRVELFRRVVQRLEGPPIRAKLIIQLFDKAFREAPDLRPMLAAQLLAASESVWQQEELWPIARDLVVPPESRKNVDPWFGIDIVTKRSQTRIDLLALRVVELAEEIGKLDELEALIVAAMKSHPAWKLGGSVTLGLIKLRQPGKLEQAKPLLEVLVQLTNSLDAGLAVFFGSERERPQRFELLTCRLGHELAVAGQFESAVSFYELTSPELALEECRLFGKNPVLQQLAVRIVNRMLAGLDDPAELTRQAGSPLFVEAAKITAEINQPYVAARLAQAMITRWQLSSANISDGGTGLEQLEQRFANARVAIKPQMLPATLNQSTRRAGGVSPPVATNASPTTSPANAPTRELTPPAHQQPRGSRVAIDLLPHVTGDSLTNLRLDSPFVSLLKEAAKDKDLWAKWTEALRGMGTLARLSDDANENDGTGKSAHPPDLSLAILASLTELVAPESNTERTALPRLVDVAKSHLKSERPRTAPPGFHPQLGLWLVARECLVREEYQGLGQELTDLATESAALHFDPRFQWAILRERGELALKSGNKELAGKLWTRLSENVLRPRSAEETIPMLLGRQFVWSANWPGTRMHHARDLCHLTLIAEMPDLSLAIFRDAVNWPKLAPFRAQSLSDNGVTVEARGNLVLDANFMTSIGVAEEILATWDTLEPKWRAKGVAADAIFATLLECVLPASRPEEVFVFAASSNAVRRAGGVSPSVGTSNSMTSSTIVARTRELTPPARLGIVPQSLALRLVELAVAENRIDVLRRQLAEREKTITNPLALRLIQLLLARQTNDDQRLETELTKLAHHEWSKPTVQCGRVAAQIVSSLAPLTERREQVAKLFEQWIPPVSKAYPRDEHPLADLRRWLVKHQLDRQQTDEAKETIAAHLRHMDGVWSGVGAMDGQHLRRLELLALARDYAAAGLERESLELLGHVADARWPDNYPDENPGSVLVLLEERLRSKPANERYLLWRSWAFLDDGRTSLRLMTGSAKSEIRNPKSEKADVADWRLISTGHLLVEAAQAADRLTELAQFVELQVAKRPSDRLHVLQALIQLAQKQMSAAELHGRRQLTLWESQSGKSGSVTRTRLWDDWLLAEACRAHEELREISRALAKRAAAGARELNDLLLLELADETRK